MMLILLGIALKSLLIAGTTLGLLALMKQRSAAERSWVAHIGLVALVLLACAPIVLPSWRVEAPVLLGSAEPTPTQALTPVTRRTVHVGQVPQTPAASRAPAQAASPSRSTQPTIGTAAAAVVIYAIPAAILLFITLLALFRLVALRARADVLVDGHWLSALARAQRRMGFKHGTALLTSNELASPISWGLMRPVILLNNRAVEASGEAEAIIAHELAHVARMDWAKLLLARIATALFWFNPFVWMLAREAHQLREETADDAVLAADIPDTDYAELLVGVARHECPGLLLGAHGVAPSKSSLARRVARVLDGASVRGPVARSFAAGVFVGAVAIAAPLAALTLTPKGSPVSAKPIGANRLTASEPAAVVDSSDAVPVDIPSIIGQGVATSVQSAVAAIHPSVRMSSDSNDFAMTGSNGSSISSVNGVMVSRSRNGASVTIYPPDAQGRRKIVARAANGATAVSYADAGEDIPGLARDRGHTSDALDAAMEMKAVGLTPAYVDSMRAVSPRLRSAEADDFVQMKAVGVTPDYAREMASAGFANLDADALTEARAVGMSASFVREMRAAGVNGSLDDFIEMKAASVTPAYAMKIRGAGYKIDVDKLVQLKAQGIDLDDLSAPPAPPAPPRPPRH